MRVTLVLATLTLAGPLAALAQTAEAPAANKLTGCLKGSKNQYYLVEQDGKRHSLIAKNQDLSSYVNHNITVTGKADTSRDPAAGNDAMGHRSGLFSVDSVSDQGSCKK